MRYPIKSVIIAVIFALSSVTYASTEIGSTDILNDPFNELELSTMRVPVDAGGGGRGGGGSFNSGGFNRGGSSSVSAGTSKVGDAFRQLRDAIWGINNRGEQGKSESDKSDRSDRERDSSSSNGRDSGTNQSRGGAN